MSTFANRAILTARNDTVHEINKEILPSLHGDITMFQAEDSADIPEDAEPIPEEVLRSFQVSGLPPSKLRLKVLEWQTRS